MNFDSVEGLTEEDILNQYNDIIYSENLQKISAIVNCNGTVICYGGSNSHSNGYCMAISRWNGGWRSEISSGSWRIKSGSASRLNDSTNCCMQDRSSC